MEQQTKIKQKRDLTCPVTGLVVEDKDTALEAISYIDAQNEQNKAIKKAIKEDYDLTEKKFIWQKGKFFNKVYKKSHRAIMTLSVNGRSLFLTFICYLDKMDNTIRYNDKHISGKDLLLISGMSKNTLQTTMKELESANIIKVEGGTRNRKIFFNPLLAEDTATEEYVHKKFI